MCNTYRGLRTTHSAATTGGGPGPNSNPTDAARRTRRTDRCGGAILANIGAARHRNAPATADARHEWWRRPPRRGARTATRGHGDLY